MDCIFKEIFNVKVLYATNPKVYTTRQYGTTVMPWCIYYGVNRDFCDLTLYESCDQFVCTNLFVVLEST